MWQTKQAVHPQLQHSKCSKAATHMVEMNGKTDREESLLYRVGALPVATEVCHHVFVVRRSMLWQREAALTAHTAGNLILFLTYRLICLARSGLALALCFLSFLLSSLLCLCVVSVCCSHTHTHTLASLLWWLCRAGECMYLCIWGRSGLPVSQLDWPALQQVDSRSRSQSQWLVSHLPPPSLHTQKQFWHSLRLPDPTSCGRFMTSWHPHSPSISPSLCSHGCRCPAWKCAHLSQLACKAISQVWHFLFIVSALLPGQEGTGIFLLWSFPCCLKSYFRVLLLTPENSLCLIPCLSALLFHYSGCSSSLIAFVSTFAPACSLLDSTSVNLPMIVLCPRKKTQEGFFHFWSTRMKPRWTCWPKAQLLSHFGQPDSSPPGCCFGQFLQTVTYCSWWGYNSLLSRLQCDSYFKILWHGSLLREEDCR